MVAKTQAFRLGSETSESEQWPSRRGSDVYIPGYHFSCIGWANHSGHAPRPPVPNAEFNILEAMTHDTQHRFNIPAKYMSMQAEPSRASLRHVVKPRRQSMGVMSRESHISEAKW